jgi:hypothetical protein
MVAALETLDLDAVVTIGPAMEARCFGRPAGQCHSRQQRTA